MESGSPCGTPVSINEDSAQCLASKNSFTYSRSLTLTLDLFRALRITTCGTELNALEISNVDMHFPLDRWYSIFASASA